MDCETFIKLAIIASCDVVMSTHDGFFKQVDGLAMGSPPAPHLANGWLSQFENVIRDDARIYDRYMDDILRECKLTSVAPKLAEINSLHPNLHFALERKESNRLPSLACKSSTIQKLVTCRLPGTLNPRTRDLS